MEWSFVFPEVGPGLEDDEIWGSELKCSAWEMNKNEGVSAGRRQLLTGETAGKKGCKLLKGKDCPFRGEWPR